MKNVLLAFFLLCPCFVQAQAQFAIPRSVTRAYAKGTRDISGKPGARYWQNTANYKIKINYNPATRLLQGFVDIHYVNNSPDTLRKLCFKLYPNLYKKGVPIRSEIDEDDKGEGVIFTAFTQANRAVALAELKVQGTLMETKIDPLMPGRSVDLTIGYRYELNKGSNVRTGQLDPGAFFVAYFFPRIAVYDDIEGWDTLPYTGAEEFYNDFVNFKVEITVPENFTVWSTGELVNAEEVLSEEARTRLHEAMTSSREVTIMYPGKDKPRANGGRAVTWKFEADNFSDFVFGGSNYYAWKSASVLVDSVTGRRTRVDVVYNINHKDYDTSLEYTRRTIEAMSFKFCGWPFPFKHMTIFDGLDEMEYPAMINANHVDSKANRIALIAHEVFHQMFPFLVGTHESKHAWMDEGWANLAEWIISPDIDASMMPTDGVERYAALSGTTLDSPVVTPTTALTDDQSVVVYQKPALGFLYLRDYLGESAFRKAMHRFIDQWKGKHPTPYDFFNSLNAGSGKDLNWFFKAWFFDDGIVDMALLRVTKTNAGYDMEIKNKSAKPLPVDLSLVYTDGTSEKIHKTVSVWERGDRQVIVPVATKKKLARVTLGGPYVPDKDPSDNVVVLN